MFFNFGNSSNCGCGSMGGGSTCGGYQVATPYFTSSVGGSFGFSPSRCCGITSACIPGPQGSVGPQGPMGPMGPQGAQGPAGPTGATGATEQVL